MDSYHAQTHIVPPFQGSIKFDSQPRAALRSALGWYVAAPSGRKIMYKQQARGSCYSANDRSGLAKHGAKGRLPGSPISQADGNAYQTTSSKRVASH